jgi:Nif-specific regulatory protein
MAHADVITDLAFPCQGNRCLTQVLHHIEREDAVRPTRLADIPIREVPTGPPRATPDAPAAPPAPAPADTTPALPAAPDADGPDDSAATRPEDGKPDGERERLVWAMERCGWVQAKAARLLKISPRQMGYALQKYGIEVRKF